jgi:hypothetical protein
MHTMKIVHVMVTYIDEEDRKRKWPDSLRTWTAKLGLCKTIRTSKHITAYSGEFSYFGQTWGTMLQPWRLPVRVPDDVDFLNLPNPSSRTMALVSTQTLTEMSTRNLPGGKKRPTRRADNLAAIYEPYVCKCGSLNLSQPQGPPRPVQG